MDESEVNVISVIISIMALSIALVGWLHWFVIPAAVVGLVVGLLSQQTSGRHIHLVRLALAMIRLALGGGML